MKTKTLHLVWNAARSECVGFLDEGDAHWTATGDRSRLSVQFATPTIGEEFRNSYAMGRKHLPQSTVEVPA